VGHHLAAGFRHNDVSSAHVIDVAVGEDEGTHVGNGMTHPGQVGGKGSVPAAHAAIDEDETVIIGPDGIE